MSDELSSMILDEGSEKMSGAVSHTRTDMATIRTGRASPVLLEKLPVEYYGSTVPMQQLANFQVPEARTLLINPFDKGSIGDIEKAILTSDLGLNPSSDGNVLRLTFPQLTEERRKDLVKVVRKMAEDGKISIRGHRRAARQDLEGLEKDGDLSEDDLARVLKQLDTMTRQHEAKIDEALTQKEKELLEV